MTKWARNVRKQSCKTSCLACTFFSICKLLLDKKKKKEKENCCHSRKFFPLQMKCFFCVKVFYMKFVPKITIPESFCQKFRDFFVQFLLAKVSAPKVPLVDFIHILTDFYHLPVSLVLFTHSLIDACEFAQIGLNHAMN